MRKTYRVRDSNTNEILEGRVSIALVRGSETKAGEWSGVRQSAYLSKGSWYYLAPTEVEHFTKHLGVTVHTVYVEEV